MNNVADKRLVLKLLLIPFCLIVFLSAGSRAAYGATRYESEPNNTYGVADETTHENKEDESSTNDLAYGHEEQLETAKRVRQDFDTLMSIKDPESIIINGQENQLLPEFSSQTEAISVAKEKCGNLLNAISKQYKTGDISDDNWKDYQMQLNFALSHSPQIFKMSCQEFDYEFLFLELFFDLYDNTEKNDLVKLAAQKGLNRTIFVNNEKLPTNEVLAVYLPWSAPYVIDYWSNLDMNVFLENDFVTEHKSVDKWTGDRAFNLNNARPYAIAYATSPNSSYLDPNKYEYIAGHDCTNFASQILHAGGISQVVYNSVYQGWWHKTSWSNGPNPYVIHSHSHSWTLADTFVRYMGIIFTTTNHYYFSKNIYAGNFIALDKDGNGDWDHIGFVTYEDNYVGSYGYFDYRVAQHTDNYHAWASSYKNKWETYEALGARYARVRH